MLQVTLYGRARCCLCDDAAALLETFRDEYGFVVTKVDIDSDPALAARYGSAIPVLLFDGGHRLALRITPERIRRSLQRATDSANVAAVK